MNRTILIPLVLGPLLVVVTEYRAVGQQMEKAQAAIERLWDAAAM